MAFFDNITEWVVGHWVYILCGGLLVYFIWKFFFAEKKTGFKPIERAEIEYKKYDERMKLNHSFYNWLWYANRNLGKIQKFRMTNLIPIHKLKKVKVANEWVEQEKSDEEIEKEKKNQIPVMEMKIKPILFKIPLINFNFIWFTKAYFLIVGVHNIRRDNSRKELIFARDLEIYGGSDKFEHIYFDRTLEEPIKDYVRNTMIYKTDLESSLSIWYAKAQEQATMNPEVAFKILLEHLKLEEAKERRSMATQPT